ncbi:MAG: putative 4-hydroxybenzoate polyprenyltransferase [Candidatus Omnitrophica bacterium]|nr:putative 4-hydroxybenzoate polyprenyltransferase [Candidatus Omnitrophota bacterium]
MQRIRKYLDLVKFSHTVFALPFALTSMLIAAGGLPSAWTIAWILFAMVCARTMAMTFNRIVDVRFDAENPRTANRPTVTGEVTLGSAWALWGLSSFGLFLSAAMLNPTCLILCPPVWLVLNGYSLCKRFTAWTHLVLGLALGLAPFGAWVAVTGRIEWAPIPLCLAVMFWVAGFDILYALQDEEVDRTLGLSSLVTRFGPKRAILVSRILHLLTVLVLVEFGEVLDLGPYYFGGVGLVALILLLEQSLVSAEDRSNVGIAFMNANAAISLTLLIATCLDLFFA